jgi:hypothetical protein
MAFMEHQPALANISICAKHHKNVLRGPSKYTTEISELLRKKIPVIKKRQADFGYQCMRKYNPNAINTLPPDA